MIILGINAYHPDASAAIVVDGKLVAAVEEERFRRIKHFSGFPKEAVNYCLKEAGISLDDIDHIAVNYDYNFYRETPNSREPQHYYRRKHNLPFKASYLRYDTDKFQSFLENMAVGYGTGYVPPVTFVKHHKAHAAAAYYSSGFTEPTLDRSLRIQPCFLYRIGITMGWFLMCQIIGMWKLITIRNNF